MQMPYIVIADDETIQAIEEISNGRDLQSVLDKCFKIGVISEAIEYVDSGSD